DLLRPDVVMPVGPFPETLPADRAIAEIERRDYTSQWEVPEEMHRNAVRALRERWGGKELSWSTTYEITSWGVSRLPELAAASCGGRNVPSSRTSSRTSVWRPPRRFSRTASRGLVGVNPDTGHGTVVVRPNLYAWSPRAPEAAVRIETPWTIRVGMPALAARSRRSTWVVAAIGSPTTRNATRWVVAASRMSVPSSTSARETFRIGRPTSSSTASSDARASPDV